jgi:hypothetical protein
MFGAKDSLAKVCWFIRIVGEAQEVQLLSEFIARQLYGKV